MLGATKQLFIMSLFIWAGAATSANMIAAPAKFQVLDLTRATALQVGRKQFLWVGYFEMALALFSILAFFTETLRVKSLVLLAIAVFVIQRFFLLPRLSVLTDQVIAGTNAGGSKLHLIFIGMEIIKLLALVVAAASALSTALKIKGI